MKNEVHPVKTKLWTVLVLSLALILVTSTFTSVVPGFIFKPALAAPTDPIITTSADGPNNSFFYDEILQVQVYDPTFDNNGISVDTRQVEIRSDFGSAPNEIFNLWEIGDSGQFEFFLVHKDSVTIPTIETDLDTNNPNGAVLSGSGGIDVDGDGFEDGKSPIIRFGTGSDLDFSGFEKFTTSFLFAIRAESTSGPSVLVSRVVQFDNTVGSVSVDRTDYGTDNLVHVTIDDQDGNLNPTNVDSFTLSPTDLFNLFDILGATFPDYITFSETGDNSAQFEAIFQLSPSDSATSSNDLVFTSNSVALTLRDVISYLPGIHSTAYDPYGLLNTASFTVADEDGSISDPGTTSFSTELKFTVIDNDQNKDSFNEDSLPPSAVKVMIDNGDINGNGVLDGAGEGDEEDIPMIETSDNTGIFIPDLPNDELKIIFLDDFTTPTPQNGILEFTTFYVPNPITIAYTDPLDTSSSPQTFNLPLTLTIQTGTVNLPSIVTPTDTFTLQLVDSDLNDNPRAVDSYTFDLGGTGPYPLKKAGVSIDSTAAIGVDIEGNPLTFATPLHYTLIETGSNTGIFVQPSISMSNILSSSGTSVPANGDNFTVKYYDKFVPTVTADTARFISSTPAVLLTDINCRQGSDFVNDPLCSSPTTPRWGEDQMMVSMLAVPSTPGNYVVLLQGTDPDGNMNYAQWTTSSFGTALGVGLSVPPYLSEDTGANTLTAKLIPGTDPSGVPIATDVVTIDVQKHPANIFLNQPSNVAAGTSLTLSGFVSDAITGERLDGVPVTFDGSGADHIQDTVTGSIRFDDPNGVRISRCSACMSDDGINAGNNLLQIDATGIIDVRPTSGIVTLVIDGMADKVFALQVNEIGGTTFTQVGQANPLAPVILHLNSPNYIDSIIVQSVDNQVDGSGGPFSIASITTNDPLGDPRIQDDIDFEAYADGLQQHDLTINSGYFYSSGDSPHTSAQLGYQAQAHFAGDSAYELTDSAPLTFMATDDPSGRLGEASYSAVGDTGRGTLAMECASDRDGDSICDVWELAGGGIPFSYNDGGTVRTGTYSLCFSDGTNCPDPDRKDIYVEVDYMTFHRPLDNAINRVVTAFANAPVASTDPTVPGGIALHVKIDEELPHNDDIAAWADSTNPNNFDTIKAAHFGTSSDFGDESGLSATSKDARRHAIKDAKAQVYHYGLSVHSIGPCGPSGLAEVGGNDFIVSLGCNFNGFAPPGTGHDDPNLADGLAYTVGTEDQQAGTFMHELGHNLNLHHGGPKNIGSTPVSSDDYTMNCKPNYPSVMSYSRQTGTFFTDRGMPMILDYSRQTLPPLREDQLDEIGLAGDFAETMIYGTPDRTTKFRFDTTYSSTTGRVLADWIDWNGDNLQNAGTVTENINDFNTSGCNSSPTVVETLVGFEDWHNLKYKFRKSPDYIDGIHENPVKLPEMPGEVVHELEVLARDYDTISPTGSVSINSGAEFANSRTVQLALLCTDNSEEGCTQLKISIDGSFDTEIFESYLTNTKLVTFAADGLAAATVQYRDGAENPAAVTQDTIIIDTVSPTVSSAQNGASYTLGAAPTTPNFACNDDRSGIASCTPSITTLDTTTGTHSYQVTATDKAGNTYTATITYNVRYQFSGFLELKTNANKGSALPVKFKLVDSSGNSINTATAQIFVDGKPGTSTGKSNSDNNFRFDSAGKQYIFNLDTKPLSAGKHTVTVQMSDGAIYSFSLTLK